MYSPFFADSGAVDDAADVGACGTISAERLCANSSDREQSVAQVHNLRIAEHHPWRQVHHPAWRHHPRRSQENSAVDQHHAATRSEAANSVCGDIPRQILLDRRSNYIATTVQNVQRVSNRRLVIHCICWLTRSRSPVYSPTILSRWVIMSPLALMQL